ncbi:MAG: 2-(1,2-epoxy-1,2-dihydrophenyl)acetyl-CoA isomerase PaaG [Bacteroidia bacterium]
MYQTLLLDEQGPIATLTLNRPDRYNAFDETMSRELIEALRYCNKTPGIRTIVITGAGKAFCSGQDLKDVQGVPRSLGESVERRYNPMVRLVRETEKPFVCKLNGVAAGAGASLALACDFVIASEAASMVWAFANIGLVLDSGSSWFLPRLAGHRKAFELAVLGERISAGQALEFGLINRVVPAEALDDTTAELAERLAAAPTRAIGLIKRMLNRSFESSLDQMLDMERDCQEVAGRSGDYIEGVMAFVQKRKPVFHGK